MKEDQMNSSPEENRDEATSQEGEEKEEKSGFTLPLSPKITASLVIGALLISFSIGYFLSPRGEDGRDQMSKKKGQGDKGNIKYWSCSMHPQIKMPKAGKCPICQMDLIPVREGGGSSEDREGPVLKLGPRARKLAEIETAPALYRRVTHKVDLIGKIAYDETLISYITTRFPGRIERLYVDFTGTLIRKGDHIAEIYSPEFRATQEELISDQKAYEEAKKTGNKLNIRMAKTKLEASKKKLKLWDLTKSQIKKILQSKSPTDEITIYATQGGTVLHKNATVGLYVKEGDKLYTTVDLKRVWLIMDAYETDLPWLKFGQEVTFQVKTYPGRTFKGRIAFIDPVLNEKTRTVKIRVNVPNPERLLKPGMLVRAQVHSQVGAEGTVINPDLASQWVCPMHPYEVSSKPGQICSRCQMDMVPAKSLGILKPSSARSRVLTIPHTAPLITGQRTVVYVRTDSDKVQHRYEGREIKLGPRAGDYYVVYEGLHEGEEVVTRGNFKIDSALQIVAKPSLMSHQPLSPPKKRQATPPFGLGRGKYHKLVEPIFSAYFKLEELLTYEKGKEAGEVAKKLITLLQEFDSSGAQSLSKGGQKKLAHLVDQIKKDYKRSKDL